MENLAYVYLADAYEAPAESYLVKESIAQWFQGLNWGKLSSASYIRFVSLGAILAVLSLTSNAWALSRGDRGDQVTFVQQTLLARNYFNGPVTGFYGELTEAAVRSFQAANQLPDSGEIDAATYSLLQQQPGASLSVPSQGFNTVANSQGLKRGDRGIQVRDLQKRLIVAGYSNVEIDAIYSSETEAAVKQFQIGYGFVPDGIADANTQKILNQKLYVVVVPVRNNTTLTRVQQIFPTAFKAPSESSRLGDYVHGGSYPNYDLAKTRVKSLQQSGIIDARVAYF